MPWATMRPWLIMITRLQEASISGRIWLEKMMVIWPWSSLMRLRMDRIWCGSSPMVGSSMSRILGFERRASAMPTRWRKPLERTWMSFFPAVRVRLQRSMTYAMRFFCSLLGMAFRRARWVRYSITRTFSGRGLFSGMKASSRLIF